MKIPVRNLWLLQLFASHLYRHSGDEFAGAERLPEDIPELVAGMLAEEVMTRLHSGLSVGFVRTSEDVRRVRGRIDLLGTTRHRLLERGKVRCQFDDIVTDTPGNRLVRAGLQRADALLPDNPLFRSLVLQLQAAGVTGPLPNPDVARSLRRQRLLAQDLRMLTLAELLLSLSIPDQSDDEFAMVSPDDSDGYLRKLFEHAAYGFYEHSLGRRGWQVDHGKRLNWDAQNGTERIHEIFPGMQTDVILRAPAPGATGVRRKIVIDTKFNRVVVAGFHREETLRSGYVFQIYAYLMSQHGKDEEHRRAEGLLLHPVVDGHVDEEITIQGHRIRFATVDLRESAMTIAKQLSDAVSERNSSET